MATTNPKAPLKNRLQQLLLLLLLPILGLSGFRAFNEWKSYQVAVTHLNLANNFIDNHQFDQAVLEFTQAVDAYPAMYPAWLGLGNALCLNNEHEKELLAFQKATSALPRKSEAHRDLALAYRELGETRASLFHLRIAANNSPEDPIFTNALIQRAERELQEGIKAGDSPGAVIPEHDHAHDHDS